MNKSMYVRLFILISIGAVAVFYYIGSWDKRASIAVEKKVIEGEPISQQTLDQVYGLSAKSKPEDLFGIFGDEPKKTSKCARVIQMEGEYWRAHANYTRVRLLMSVFTTTPFPLKAHQTPPSWPIDFRVR